MRSLPVISSCSEIDCFYNRTSECHAPAINVGGIAPKCETFTRTATQSHIGRRRIGKVGACRKASCRWNAELTCTAPAITVGREGAQPRCLTFEPKTG